MKYVLRNIERANLIMVEFKSKGWTISISNGLYFFKKNKSVAKWDQTFGTIELMESDVESEIKEYNDIIQNTGK